MAHRHLWRLESGLETKLNIIGVIWIAHKTFALNSNKFESKLEAVSLWPSYG